MSCHAGGRKRIDVPGPAGRAAGEGDTGGAAGLAAAGRRGVGARVSARALRLPRAFISDHPLPWLLPLIVILAVFAFYPLFYNIWLSFHEFVPRKRAVLPVGFDNW